MLGNLAVDLSPIGQRIDVLEPERQPHVARVHADNIRRATVRAGRLAALDGQEIPRRPQRSGVGDPVKQVLGHGSNPLQPVLQGAGDVLVVALQEVLDAALVVRHGFRVAPAAADVPSPK